MARQTRKTCVFCQRADQKISKEHLWPNWILECLPPHEKLAIEMYRRVKDAKRWMPKDNTGIEVNDICVSCNSEWMNRLEEAARPFLCSMISGKSNVVLDEHKATSLTAWIYKIMLLFDLSGPAEYRRFRRAHYQSFYKEHRVARL